MILMHLKHFIEDFSKFPTLTKSFCFDLMTSVKAETPIMCIFVSCSLSGGQRSVQQDSRAKFSSSTMTSSRSPSDQWGGCLVVPRHTLTIIARELSQQQKKGQERFQRFQLPASQTSFNFSHCNKPRLISQI